MRIRTIKPDFWLHEGLAQLSATHRLLFIGLWMLADKAGRLEDRPKRIAAALFPYEPAVDVDRMLQDLDEAGLVHRYGDQLLAIPGFKEHQRPHPKEAASTHPEPPSREKKRRAVESPEGRSSIPSTPVGREGKESQEGKGREGKEKQDVLPPPPAVDPLEDHWMPEAVEPPNKFADSGAFEEWFQFKRGEAGYIREKRVNAVARGKWWTEVHVALNGDPTPLEGAALEFAKDPHWEAAKPSMPFRAFMSEWRKYIGRRAA